MKAKDIIQKDISKLTNLDSETFAKKLKIHYVTGYYILKVLDKLTDLWRVEEENYEKT